MFKKDALGAERRQYIRLDSVFPVLFRVLSLDGNEALSEWLQGFTNNVGKGGICLAVNNLKPAWINPIKQLQVKMQLEIHMPLSACGVPAYAKVAWVKETGTAGSYLIGLSYESIAVAANARIMRYATVKKLSFPAAITTIAILALGLSAGSYINMKLVKGNQALVEQLVRILQESSVAKQTIKAIDKEKTDLQLKMQTLQLRIKTAEDEKTALQRKLILEEKEKIQVNELNKKIREAGSTIEKLIVEKASLQEQLIAVQNKESTITEELLRLDKKKATLEKANLDKMYQWIKIHQNPRTGLVMSFEGDGDLGDWAFLYDQSLVAQAFNNFSDFERAKAILDFFKKKAKKTGGLFYNAYYVNDGDIAEAILHSGPNIWLGIAALQYTQKSRDQSYLPMAEEIGRAIIELQEKDSDKGIRGGPDVEWYATEHNLDAYSFFNMLYKITNDNKYLEARDKALDWLLKHTYDKQAPPIKRGKGDSTIATDTYAWSIAAIGPEKLLNVGMNPDMVMEFAEKNCMVEVDYERPGGEVVKIKGFDFAPQRHLSRGGLVSSEWTAQMIMSFKIMADFYYKKDMIAKARTYELKADEYLRGMGNMIISSPSPSGQGESCLPYATQDFADTGHGWSTPKGKSTGSLAGTAYTLFAYYNYNPLELK
ncbi:MAG: hypothetical protein PHE18_00945 [Candidatus Omnitrophica bacterium]|nr:hypothetical protein [Candidatus Omnitrophota bacterium]MDD5552429.1 hypothetical protein [Candidatus Omnitrophota bacterium]